MEASEWHPLSQFPRFAPMRFQHGVLVARGRNAAGVPGTPRFVANGTLWLLPSDESLTGAVRGGLPVVRFEALASTALSACPAPHLPHSPWRIGSSGSRPARRLSHARGRRAYFGERGARHALGPACIFASSLNDGFLGVRAGGRGVPDPSVPSPSPEDD